MHIITWRNPPRSFTLVYICHICAVKMQYLCKKYETRNVKHTLHVILVGEVRCCDIGVCVCGISGLWSTTPCSGWNNMTDNKWVQAIQWSLTFRKKEATFITFFVKENILLFWRAICNKTNLRRRYKAKRTKQLKIVDLSCSQTSNYNVI